MAKKAETVMQIAKSIDKLYEEIRKNPWKQEDAQTSAVMERLANNPALHRALDTSPDVLAHHVPLEMEGTNEDTEDSFWHTENFPK